jgi:hypothetical protein
LLVKSFTNGTAHKIARVSAGKTAKLKCTTAVNAKVRMHKIVDILTLFLWPFIKTINL